MDIEIQNHVKTKTSENINVKIPSKEDISVILEIVRSAYLDHQLIPTLSGDYLQKNQIRGKYLSQIIEYCMHRNLFDALAYLYYEWFKHDQFILWARSNNSKVICRYRTSMFAESHFR